MFCFHKWKILEKELIKIQYTDGHGYQWKYRILLQCTKCGNVKVKRL